MFFDNPRMVRHIERTNFSVYSDDVLEQITGDDQFLHSEPVALLGTETVQFSTESEIVARIDAERMALRTEYYAALDAHEEVTFDWDGFPKKEVVYVH